MSDGVKRHTSHLKPAFRFLKNTLNKLRLKCQYNADGCRSTVSLEHIESHEKLCAFHQCTTCGLMPISNTRLQDENQNLKRRIQILEKVLREIEIYNCILLIGRERCQK